MNLPEIAKFYWVMNKYRMRLRCYSFRKQVQIVPSLSQEICQKYNFDNSSLSDIEGILYRSINYPIRLHRGEKNDSK